MEPQIESILTFDPSEFRIDPPRLIWNRPCYFQFEIIFSPQSQAAWENLAGDFTLHYQVDAFAKHDILKRLWACIYDCPIRLLKNGKFHSAWLDVFLKLYDELKKHLLNPNHYFPPPFHFVPRKNFTRVDLRTILQENPNQLDVYVIAEERRLGEECFLRIHSSLSFVAQQGRYLWFEKRMPWRLHREDILPWFLATINRLPQKARPSNLQFWQERLLSYEPDLVFQTDKSRRSWAQRPKVILVLGPQSLVGYRCLFHLERQNINRVLRHHEVITIIAQTKMRFVNKTEFVESWKFHILTDGESSACEIEKQIVNGDRIHFGLDVQIVGMMAHEYERNEIYAINVPEVLISRLCLDEQQCLKLKSSPKERVKAYDVMKVKENRPPSP